LEDGFYNRGEGRIIVGASRQGVGFAVLAGRAIFDVVGVAVEILGPSDVAGKKAL